MHQKFVFSSAIISGNENQGIFVQTRDENIEIEPITFVVRSLLKGFVRLQQAE